MEAIGFLDLGDIMKFTLKTRRACVSLADYVSIRGLPGLLETPSYIRGECIRLGEIDRCESVDFRVRGLSRESSDEVCWGLCWGLGATPGQHSRWTLENHPDK